MKKLLFIVMLSGTICSRNVSKITDPQDPKFDPEKFRFEDYESASFELHEALELVAPKGAYKNKVDRILIEKAKAKELLNPGCNNITYYKLGIGNLDKYSIRIQYDQELKVTDVYAGQNKLH